MKREHSRLLGTLVLLICALGYVAALVAFASVNATLRQQVELTDLSTHLVGVVDETMRPAHVSLWLRDRPNRGGSQAPSQGAAS